MSSPEALHTEPAGSAPAELDVEGLRDEFPVLEQRIHGHPLVYLDNAASSQSPERVVEAVARYRRHDHANVHRGVHALSIRATEAYETGRQRVARFLGAAEPSEVIFVRGTTEAVNLVADAWGRSSVEEGDEILLTEMEHHSNLVPWQLLAERTGARLRFVGVTPEGRLDMEDLDRLLGSRTVLVGVTHVSNTLGVVNPVGEIAERAHAAGALCLVDGAQAVPHLPVDVARIGCDFYAFSGHKVYGPTGIGALWARAEILDRMPPYQGGGEMIASVSLERSTWAEVPHKFEAGTPNISGAVGLGEALAWVEELGREALRRHEERVTAHAVGRLGAVEGLTLYGPPDGRTGVLSFRFRDVHAHDLATILDHRGIAIRAGHHCNQPLMERLGVDATARASLAVYNTTREIDALVEGLHVAADVFGRGGGAG